MWYHKHHFIHFKHTHSYGYENIPLFWIPCDMVMLILMILILMIRTMLADCGARGGASRCGEHQSTDCNQLHTCTCTLHNVQCAVCTVQCEVCSVHSVHCKQRAPIYWLQSTSHMQLPAAKVHCKCKVQHIEHCTLQFWHQQFAVHQHQLILQTSKHCISATDYRCSLYFIMFCYVHNIAIEHVRCEICNRLQISHCTVPLLQSLLYR